MPNPQQKVEIVYHKPEAGQFVKRRHPVGVAGANNDGLVVAVCSDGSVWGIFADRIHDQWHSLSPIPGTEADECVR